MTPSLSDRSHIDPCRFCRTTYFRYKLIRAAVLMGEGKRGYVCHPCATRRGLK